MSQTVYKQQNNTWHEVRADYHVSMQDARKSVLILVTDDQAFYKEVSNQQVFIEEIVWIPASSILKKERNELRELLEPARAVLIDWSVYAADLIDTIRKGRVDCTVPVLALCSHQEADHVAALVLGADTTIHRLLDPVMLNAKLVAYHRSIEEKAQNEQNSLIQLQQNRREKKSLLPATHNLQDSSAADVLSLDKVARVFFAASEQVSLTSIEFDLMAMLMNHAGVCLKRDQIINVVWGIEYETGTNFLDVHIHAIRRKLKKAGVPACIFTVRGIGYRFEKPSMLDTAV